MKDIRLLLVDDEPTFLETLTKRLRKRDFLPELAASGSECLALMEEKPADVVVLDVKMPGMNGIEVLNRIKEKYPETEVILLTGQATARDGVDGIKAGAFDYLTKPIEFEHLLGKIHQAYEKIKRQEEKRKEAEFRVRMEQQIVSTERLAALGTLAAGIAHEINNPLAIINESTGWLSQILKKEELSAIPRKQDMEMALGKIQKAIDRARRITHQLLGFVRKNDSTCLEIHPAELVDEAVELVRQEAETRKIRIEVVADHALGSVWSDPYPLRQVLINLLTNAIQAIPGAGTITIRMESLGEQFSIAVKDTGEGIPKENLGKIFEPFFTTKPPDKGTGLGLFVSRGIVEKLGGTIQVESRLGHGSSFCIKMPKIQKSGSEEKECRPEQWLGKIKEGHVP